LRQPWTAIVPDVSFPELTEAAQKATVRAEGAQGMPAGIEVTITGTTTDGKEVREVYHDYFGGDFGPNFDLRDDKPLVSFIRPPKKKVYLKPDIIAYQPHTPPRVLFLRGLYNRYFRVDEAVKTVFPDAVITDSWLDKSDVGEYFTVFPADYTELMSYDLIVLANAPMTPLGLVGEEMLKDYLLAGGNVLLLGGDEAYGQAGFQNDGLIALLPVELGSKYNWRKIPGGAALHVAATSPLTAGVTFGPRDMLYYRQLCVPKPGMAVPVTAGGNPLLVLGSTPQGGRLACVLATPFGEATPGETAFWDVPSWRTLMGNTVRWLVRHE
jgi:uncharacterized membrane protein